MKQQGGKGTKDEKEGKEGKECSSIFKSKSMRTRLAFYFQTKRGPPDPCT